MSDPRLPRTLFAWVLILLSAGPFAAIAGEPQELPAVRPADYGQWESMGFRTPMSPDGSWIAVPISRVDGTHELRAFEVAGAEEPVVVAEGTAPVFANNSAWLGYRIGHSEADEAAMGRDDETVRDRLGLLDLRSREIRVFEQVASFAFSGGGGYLAMHRYAAETDDDSGRSAADLVVQELVSGVEISFGNVSEYAWQSDGDLLAIVIDAQDPIGNGVQLYAPATGVLRVLDSGATSFAKLSWRDDADDLAFYREREVDGFEEARNEVVAWRGLAAGGSESRYDQQADTGFPVDMHVAAHRSVVWSDSGATLFFGIQDWHVSAETDADETSQTTGEEGAGSTDAPENGENGADGDDDGDAAPAEPEEIEPSDVEIWHSRDERIIPMQKVSRERDRQATYLVSWTPDQGRFLRIGTDLMERTQLLEGQRHATQTDRSAYQFDNMFDRDNGSDRAWNDVWLIDLSTGKRRKVIESVGYYYGGSPTGAHLLYYKNDQFWVYDIAADAHRELTGNLPISFVDDDYDTPVGRQRPPWGFGGWLADDQAVFLYDRYDVWVVRPDGVGAWRVTKGAETEVRHRVIDLDRDQPGLDGNDLYLSLYGEWSKKFGYAHATLALDGAESGVRDLVFLDKNVSGLTKATEVDVYSYLVQGFDDSPDLFVGGSELADARQITNTNSFQDGFAWGRSELIDFESTWGRRLQGALFYPANYDPAKKYPMLVYVYERPSETVRSYSVPTQRDEYVTSVFNAEGYFVLRPDIVFRNRRPGTSAVECVVPAVEAAIATGMIDADRVGLVGHSWGGYEAAFVPTQTNIFSAAIAGAPLTNFLSMYGTVHWNQGLPETSHFETGQARMEVPYWEDMEAYIRESPIAHITQLETPMLIFFGDKDGSVDWHQGVEMYNYARRAGKELVMLVYPGEGHHASRKNNQVDYHRRVLQWFGHYLKGDEAARWITEGAPVLQRERELKALRAATRQQ